MKTVYNSVVLTIYIHGTTKTKQCITELSWTCTSRRPSTRSSWARRCVPSPRVSTLRVCVFWGDVGTLGRLAPASVSPQRPKQPHSHQHTQTPKQTKPQVGLEDLRALQPAVAHSMARMLDPATFSDADFECLDQRFELSYEAYGALKVRFVWVGVHVK